MKKYYEQYGDIIYQISPDMFASENLLKSAIKTLQLTADKEAIYVDLNLNTEALSKWKEEMSSS